ncbi:hypothetical protein GGU45_004142 [Niabella hirudinis]
MIFLSAQPGKQYFLWQLDLLIYNLHNPEVGKESIHILLSYKKNITNAGHPEKYNSV